MTASFYRLLFSSGSAQLLLLLANLLMSFLYTSSDIGAYGFFITLASIFSIISSLRLDYFSFFASPADGLKKESALQCAVLIVIFINIGIMLACLFGKLSMAYGFCLSLSFASFSFFYLMTQVALQAKEYKVYGYARVMQGMVVILLLIGLQTYGYIGLVVASALSQIVVGIYLFNALECRYFQVFRDIYHIFSYRIKDRGINVASTLLQNMSPALPMMLGIYFFSKKELGVYFLLSQLIGGAASVLRRSILALLSTELMQEGVINFDAIKSIRFIFMSGVGVAFSVPLLILLMPRIPFFPQAQWSLIVSLLPSLFFLYALDAFIQPIGTLLPALGRHVSFFAIELARLLLLILALCSSAYLQLSMSQFIAIYALIMGGCYIVSSVLFLKCTNRVAYEG